jgi:hypothetical protein
VDEIFKLNGSYQAPSFDTDEYLLEQLKQEIEAAKARPASLEDNLKEIDKI